MPLRYGVVFFFANKHKILRNIRLFVQNMLFFTFRKGRHDAEYFTEQGGIVGRKPEKKCICGSDLKDFDFCCRDNNSHDYSKARLVGFTDPRGKKCAEQKCGRVYGYDGNGVLRLVIIRHKDRKIGPHPDHNHFVDQLRVFMWTCIFLLTPNVLGRVKEKARDKMHGHDAHVVDEWCMD